MSRQQQRPSSSAFSSPSAANRPSPRWREPLVEEFPAPTNSAEREEKWRRPLWEEEEEEGRKKPFFSEEFYREFPHLRQTTSSIGGRGDGWADNGRRKKNGGRSGKWRTMSEDEEEFHSHLDRFDRNWRDDPFWRDLYPRWAEPVFSEGIDVKTNVVNDNRRFAVDIDTYQFRPEELQVKTMDDTLLIEGRHEDVRDRDNYTKMHFVRKYQLPSDVDPHSISSHIDSAGHLTVEAQKRYPAIEGERAIPIESGSRFGSRLGGGGTGSRADSYSPRDRYYADSGRGSANDYFRNESRLNGVGGGGYLSPNPRSEGYRTEFESKQTGANGMRHEAHREQFREDFRRGGSATNLLPPPASPLFRTESRGAASGGEERRESHHFRRTASASSREFRSGAFSNGENLLRPAEELGGRSSAFGTRNVPIQRG